MDTTKWTLKIEQITKEFQSAFSDLTENQLNWNPKPNSWSIAQNIDHLIKINESYYPIFESLKAQKNKLPLIARFGFLVNFFGNFIYKSVLPDRKKKSKTFPIWEPSVNKINSDILDRFAQHQQDLVKRIADSSTFLDNGAVISSPANKNIVYTLEKALDIIVSHEARHLAQSLEIRAQLNSSM